eukprot:4021155-Prymnesium_polylepis.1
MRDRLLATGGKAGSADSRQSRPRERRDELGRRAGIGVGEATASELRLGDDAGEGQHRGAAVGQLLLCHRALHLRRAGGAEAERVELEVARGRGVGIVQQLEDLGDADGDLNHRDREEHEEHRAVVDARVVRINGRDLGRKRNTEA